MVRKIPRISYVKYHSVVYAFYVIFIAIRRSQYCVFAVSDKRRNSLMRAIKKEWIDAFFF